MPYLNFIDFPVLNTKRLALRRITEADDKAIFKLRSNDAINLYIDRPTEKKISETQDFIVKINNGINENKWLYWVLCLKESHTLIGTVCLWNLSEDELSAEIGYELSPDFHGKGFMDEALGAIINHCFTKLNLEMLCAYTHHENTGSRNLLEKNKFKIDVNKHDTENINNLIYILTADQS